MMINGRAEVVSAFDPVGVPVLQNSSVMNADQMNSNRVRPVATPPVGTYQNRGNIVRSPCASPTSGSSSLRSDMFNRSLGLNCGGSALAIYENRLRCCSGQVLISNQPVVVDATGRIEMYSWCATKRCVGTVVDDIIIACAPPCTLMGNGSNATCIMPK